MHKGLLGEVNREGWQAVQVSPPSMEKVSYCLPSSVLAHAQSTPFPSSTTPGS